MSLSGKVIYFGSELRAIAGNSSHIEIFFFVHCIQFVLCKDCQSMK